MTYRLRLTGNFWWRRPTPCCQLSQLPDKASDWRNSKRPFALHETTIVLCMRNRCCWPRICEEACYRTRCAHSCRHRKTAGGPSAEPDCCGRPIMVYHVSKSKNKKTQWCMVIQLIYNTSTLISFCFLFLCLILNDGSWYRDFYCFKEKIRVIVKTYINVS